MTIRLSAKDAGRLYAILLRLNALPGIMKQIEARLWGRVEWHEAFVWDRKEG